ncbi:MAG: response regulator transcription factor [Verrucomicrobiales bacterium]|nr:response regulator transcription factor [Verrucomicrobiales bacterium]MCP5527113.1 response regulator transcription factor [Verrucomicrobiales bacterium]
MTTAARSAPIRLLLVDDHPIVRAGLRVVEEVASDIRVVGEADSIESALRAVARLHPEVVLLDLRLPDGDGLDVCRQVKLSHPRIRFLCLTSYADAPLVLAAMEAGAEGYLLKHNDALRIAEAVREVMAGNPVFDHALGSVAAPAGGKPAANPLASLTRGELRVLAEVAKGLTDKEVAQALDLGVKTVRNTLDRVFVKLRVHTRTQAAILFAGQDRSP